MLTPGRGYSASRLWTTEEGVRRHDASKDARHSRDAKPFSQQRGRHRGKTMAALAKGETVEVAIWYHDGTEYIDSQKRVTARCWFLNEADTIAADTKVFVERMPDLSWEITQAWCEVDDTVTETAGSPAEVSPGEQSAIEQMMAVEGGGEVVAAPEPFMEFGQQEGVNPWQD